MSDPTDPTEPTDMSDMGDSTASAQDDAVRAALAEAGGPVEVPADVAARLEETLAELVAERPVVPLPATSSDHTGVVLPMDAAARKRRTRVRVLLGAAAAVLVAGLAGGVLTEQSADDLAAADQIAAADPARSEAAGQADVGADAAGGLAEAPEALRDDAADAERYAAEELDGALEEQSVDDTTARALARKASDGPVREIRADQLRADLTALQHASVPADADYAAATLLAPEDFVCEEADFGAGFLVGVTYEGRPAVVAFREPVGSTQAAEVLACGTADVLHSTTLPVAS